MAPSHDPKALPEIARWKLSNARKFKLDLFWISQHEDGVSRPLFKLTNYVWVCRSWFDGLLFSAKSYEPQQARRQNKHLTRVVYPFRRKLVSLYDTLEAIPGDWTYSRDGTMARAHDLAVAYNKKRGVVGREQATEEPARPWAEGA